MFLELKQELRESVSKGPLNNCFGAPFCEFASVRPLNSNIHRCPWGWISNRCLH